MFNTSMISIVKKLNIQFFFNISIVLMPIFLITGPFFSDLLVLVFNLIFFYLLIKKRIILKKSFYIYFYLAFLSLILVSTIFSVFNNIFVSGGYLFYFRFPIFALVTLYALVTYPNIKYYLFWVLSFTIVILFIDSFKEYFTGYNLLQYRRIVDNRISSLFGDEHILGKFIIFLLPLYTYLFLDNFSKIKNYFFYFFLSLAVLIVILSGERTALILTITFLTIYFIFCPSLKFYNSIFFLLVMSIFFLILILDKEMYQRLIIESFKTINIFADPEKFSVNLKYYLNMIYVSIDIFKENYLIGAGPKSYRLLCQNYIDIYQYACSTHPHNLYLQLLSEVGIIAFTFFISIWLLICFILLKTLFTKLFYNEKINEKFIILISNYFLVLFPFLPSSSFFNNWHNILYYFPLGFLLFEIIFSNRLNYKIFDIKIIDIKYK